MKLEQDNYSIPGPKYIIKEGSIKFINKILSDKNIDIKNTISIVDIYFKNKKLPKELLKSNIYYYDSSLEPHTFHIDNIILKFRKKLANNVQLIIGFGGGSVMDVAKAFSIGYFSSKKIEYYQGWNKKIGKTLIKIGIPTISGTGAESTKTCVLINKEKNIKLGINSEKSVFDYIILDPNLIKSVPKKQYFFTAMDAYIHSFECLEGRYRNNISDVYSKIVIDMFDEIFKTKNIKSSKNRKLLMIASYLGGVSIANSYVGLVHPISAGLSTVYGIHHCEANCIALNSLKKYYPLYFNKFSKYAKSNKIKIRGIPKIKTQVKFEKFYDSVMIHSKPLTNALGINYKNILSKNELKKIFTKMQENEN